MQEVLFEMHLAIQSHVFIYKLSEIRIKIVVAGTLLVREWILAWSARVFRWESSDIRIKRTMIYFCTTHAVCE